jgi:hypothetical protein
VDPQYQAIDDPDNHFDNPKGYHFDVDLQYQAIGDPNNHFDTCDADLFLDDKNLLGDENDENQEEDNEEGNTDHSPSPQIGNKCPHSPMGTQGNWRLPIKVHVMTGAKPKAGDYEVAIQNILSVAICIYCGYLCTETPFPGLMVEVRWTKRAWLEGCEECEARIQFNSEIIKLVHIILCVCPQLILLSDYQPWHTPSWTNQDQDFNPHQGDVWLCHQLKSNRDREERQVGS